MARVTGIQRREARSNQSDNYTNYDQYCDADHLDVVPEASSIRLFFRKRGDDSLGVGIRFPRDMAVTLANIVEAVDAGSVKISIELK